MDWRDQRDADVTAPRKLDLSGHRLIPRLTLVTLGPGAQKGRSRRPRMPPSQSDQVHGHQRDMSDSGQSQN